METNEYADWTVEPHKQNDLAFLFGVDVEEETDSRLRVLLTYIESPAAIERKEFKQLEFWMFKEDGAKLASVLTRLTASNGMGDDADTEDVPPNKGSELESFRGGSPGGLMASTVVLGTGQMFCTMCDGTRAICE